MWGILDSKIGGIDPAFIPATYSFSILLHWFAHSFVLPLIGVILTRELDDRRIDGDHIAVEKRLSPDVPETVVSGCSVLPSVSPSLFDRRGEACARLGA